MVNRHRFINLSEDMHDSDNKTQGIELHLYILFVFVWICLLKALWYKEHLANTESTWYNKPRKRATVIVNYFA